MRTWDEATAVVRHASSIAVITHLRPDGDAIGSAGAVARLAEACGTRARILVGQSEPLPEALAQLPAEVHTGEEFDLGDVDALVVCDCGSAARTGLLEAQVRAFEGPVVVVDHHASNPGYGTVNIIAPEVESTCSLVWEWFRAAGVTVDDVTATLLYAGVVTDTGNFRWGRPQARDIAADLVECGADAEALVFHLMDAIPSGDLAVIGQVLATVEIHGPVAVLRAPYTLLAQASTGAGERIIDFARGINDPGVEIVAVLKESQPGVVSGSLRSRGRDVARIAVALGGGGHVRAAGFTLRADLATAERRLLAAVHEAE
ncbi:exopolyphosphatase [Corynebacterium sp. 13CS0277]|uniref:DHH family phosphoesterase n=1 Tax=Corynebacterium sp. 13CS0277 TaxID=2071994 RepID=UPI000D03BB01|nr:bifunctional oligoribonuclease/PAP phosphatase NrnA [Corynebacterium sp. 13CS0277]PRQ12618.1 exopolyphosphatase [Corynebacterium sp. 13CS0277]